MNTQINVEKLKDENSKLRAINAKLLETLQAAQKWVSMYEGQEGHDAAARSMGQVIANTVSAFKWKDYDDDFDFSFIRAALAAPYMLETLKGLANSLTSLTEVYGRGPGSVFADSLSNARTAIAKATE